MIELFYFHDATCGIKARLALMEKGVRYTARVLDRFELTRPEYLAINPKGVVPTLIHDGQILFESSVICLYADDAFSGPPLKPETALDRARMYTWLKTIDEQYFKGIGSITFGFAIRKKILAQYTSEEGLEEYFQSVRVPEYRERRRSIVALGPQAPAVRDGLHTLAGMIETLDASLQHNAFAAGPRYSLADACLTPLVMRLEVFGLARLWEERPRVADWWSRVQQRDSYQRLLQESFPDQYFQDMHELVGDIWPDVSGLLTESA